MASDIFAKIGDIKGESLDDKHKDEIELVSFSWGVTEAPAAAGRSTSRPQFSELHITKLVDKASPLLFLACASGKHLKEATLSVRRAAKTQIEYLKIKLTDVIVTSVQFSSGGEDVSHESVSLAYEKIELNYTPQTARGLPGQSIKAGWDLSRNVKL